MMFTVIKSSVIILLLTTVCNGFRLPARLQKRSLPVDVDDKHTEAIQSTTESVIKKEQSRGVLEDLNNVPLEQNASTSESLNSYTTPTNLFQSSMDQSKEISAEIESRIDKGPAPRVDGQYSKVEKSEGFTDGPNFNPDRTGLLFGLFPFLGGYGPNSGRSHRPSHSFPPRPHSPNYHPKPQHIPNSPFKPHEYDDYSPKPEPLPPFPPDGPIFSDYVSGLSEGSPHHFQDYESEDFKIPEKGQYSSEQSGFDGGFEFDFDPPDFFEHSGFPYPPEEDYHLQNDEPHQDDGGDLDYPMKPYSDDDKFEFFPPESYDGFIPTIYKGPPKPIKHIPPGPKPGPPLPPPHKFMYPPDLNTIIEKNIYREDIPYKEVHNERDKITDDLDDAGINGLDPDTMVFIQTHTRPYVESHNSFDDNWKRKDVVK
ncbi:uncharacterized protein [Palaemon carinicauda]|uniref:uncharacterized protein n=1 Tax=Palaemon carinicauda TaxID=392227 RepID=UPI0035B5E015